MYVYTRSALSSHNYHNCGRQSGALQASSLVALCLLQKLLKRGQHVDALLPTLQEPHLLQEQVQMGVLVTFVFPTLAGAGGRSDEALPLAGTDAGQHAAAAPGPSQ